MSPHKQQTRETTQTQTQTQTETETVPVPVLKLNLQGQDTSTEINDKKHVQWEQDVVDNEHMNKKKSKSMKFIINSIIIQLYNILLTKIYQSLLYLSSTK